jgi:hypothetical protein
MKTKTEKIESKEDKDKNELNPEKGKNEEVEGR